VEVLQDVEVEGRRDHLAVLVPFAASTGQKSQTQPGMSEIINVRLGYQGLTAKYKLCKNCDVY